jgi:hypothetical protein
MVGFCTLVPIMVEVMQAEDYILTIMKKKSRLATAI